MASVRSGLRVGTAGPSALPGFLLAAFAFLVFFAVNGRYSSGRPDFYYLAEAFLHGRTWLDAAPGSLDVVTLDGHAYVPFAPFPAIALMPLVAVVGRETAVAWEQAVNAGIAAGAVGLCWALLGRLRVSNLGDRLWIVLLFAFSTAILWVTTRGGVWHTGHLVATVLTLLALLESFGRRRPLLIGLLAGAAFLTRAPLILAVPFYAWAVLPRPGDSGWYGGRHPSSAHRWFLLALGLAPSIAFALWYNAVRFGSPLESGYALATVPSFLESERAMGLFSLAHLPTNLRYFLLEVPRLQEAFPILRPDGFGMSILLTSPGLLLASRADWLESRAWTLLVTAALVLAPSLLYYGGGWLQYGYRYFLDSLPFVIALTGLAAARVGVGSRWKALICFGMVINAIGIYWAYNM